MSNYDFCINLLKKIYKKDFVVIKTNKYEVFIRQIPYNIETKYNKTKKTISKNRNVKSNIQKNKHKKN